MVLPVNLMEMHIPVFALNIIRESIVNSVSFPLKKFILLRA